MSAQGGEEDSDDVNSTYADTLIDNKEQTSKQAAKAPILPKKKNEDTMNVILNITFNNKEDYSYLYKLCNN